MSEYNEINTDVKERLQITENSYMSKEELLAILEKLNFKAIESCSLNLITDFIYDSEKDKIETRTKSISVG